MKAITPARLAASVVLAAINVAGGFLVTHRMLEMFRKKTPKRDKAEPKP